MIGNYLFGEDGTTNTQQSDFYMLGFYNPDKSFDILNYMHMQLINNWESHSSYEGYPRGPDAKSVLNSTAFTKLETTTQKGVVNWLNNLSDVCISYSIAITPFEHIVEPAYSSYALCPPGVGRSKFKAMGLVLHTLLSSKLLPMNDNANDTDLSHALEIATTRLFPMATIYCTPS
jgi:hypothetical protein